MSGDQPPFRRLATEGYVTNALNGTLGALASSTVSTMPRQIATNSVGGTTASGTIIAALATCSAAATYRKIRFCTGSTAPVLTDARAGIWNGATGGIMAQTDNSASLVNTSNTLFELILQGTLDLIVGQQVYIGLALIGTTIGTYFGTPGHAAINSIQPQLTRIKTGWTTGPLTDLSGTSSNGILWAELVT